MKIDHLTLLVSSLERSMPYYECLLPLLGFLKKRDHVWSNSSGFFLQFGEAAAGSRPYERYGAGMNHVGFAAETPLQIHAIRESMLSAGFDVPEIQNLGGAVALFMKDPDGMRFEITSNPPGSDPVD
jgi:catechol 2,3-dioxygenase-like lactoylglutathione lyase family enzyme